MKTKVDLTLCSESELVPLDPEGASGVFGGNARAASVAFRVGYAIGGVLDRKYGLSDRISDWAARNFPWPF